MDSWLKSTDLLGPAACPAPAAHRMYCPVDCPCCTERDSELPELKDQMHLIVQTLGIKVFFKTHMRSRGALLVGKETELSEEATEIFPLLLRWILRPPMHGSAEVNLKKGLKLLVLRVGRRRPGERHRMPSELPPALPLVLLIPTP